MNLLPAPKPIAEYEGVDRRRFLDEIRPKGEPAVLRGLAEDWPAVAKGREGAEAIVGYLRNLATPMPVRIIFGPPEIEGRFFYDDAMTRLNFSQGTADFQAFLDRLLRDRGTDRPHAVAVQSTPVPELLPRFVEDNRTDLLGSEVTPRLWMGNVLRVAPHYDLMENIGCVVAGRRRFTLFPPDQVRNLYPGPFELTPAGTPVSMVDIHNPDLGRFPRFAEAAAHAEVAVLEPGDAIYIPFHWWHAVDSLDPVNLFINYWWNPAPPGLANPYEAMLLALLAFRNMPEDQRDAWREMFDNYVFAAHGDPTAHLPPHARGFLGASPDQFPRMRATLKKSLANL